MKLMYDASLSKFEFSLQVIRKIVTRHFVSSSPEKGLGCSLGGR